MEPVKDRSDLTQDTEIVGSEANLLSWSSKTEYIIAQMGFCVGLGTVWKFPSLCHQNGGVTFLMAYILLLFILGIPLMFMEMALGQKVRFGVWSKIHLRLSGVGLACSLVCFLMSIYYSMFIAWSIYYLNNSLQYPLPWSRCPVLMNTSFFDPECAHTTPPTYFWYRQTLEITGSIQKSGGIVLNLSVYLLVVWLLIILLSIQSIRVKGKILCFSMVISLAILFCFLIRSYLLEGSIYGLRHLMSAKVSAIVSPKLWKQAGMQVFYNMGLGFGSIIILSSYIRKSENCAQDAFTVVFFNLAFCLLATQVVSSMLGFRATMSTRECSNRNSQKLLQLIKMGRLPLEAMPPRGLLKLPVKVYTTWLHHLNSDLKKKILVYVTDCNLEKVLILNIEGASLVFVAITEALTKFPGSPFWSIIFFLMLISMGLSTSLGLMQGILTPLLYNFPSLQNSSLVISVTIGCLGFLFGLLFAQRSGLYFLNLFDEFAVSLLLIIMVFFENIGVAWIYGVKRFMKEAWEVMGYNVSLIHEYLLCYVSLLILSLLLISNLLEMWLKYPTYYAWDKNSLRELMLPYPKWALILGSGLILLPTLIILVGLFKGSKKTIILPLLKNNAPVPSTRSSLTYSQDHKAASSRMNAKLVHSHAAEARESLYGPWKQPHLLHP